MLKEYEKSFSLIQKTLDIFVVLICWFTAYFIRFEVFENAEAGLEVLFLKLSVVLCFLTYWNFLKEGLYFSQRFNSKYVELFKVIRANFFTMSSFIIILYFFAQNRLSRITLVIYFTLSSLVFIFMKTLVRKYLKRIRKKGMNLRHVRLVGNNPNLFNYIDSVRKLKDSGISIRDWLDSSGLNKTKNIEEDSGAEPDLYIVSYTGKDKFKENEFLKKHYNDVTPIKIIPDLSYSLVGHVVEDFEGIPLLSCNEPSFSLFEMFLKNIVDKIVVFVGLIMISPLLIFISVIIKITSKGPILYGQERITKDGQKFNMLKFRSMRPAKEGEDLTTWKSEGDPRITKIGNILRKTSLDELPQLINILKGDMSLVGPRPERTHFVTEFKNSIPNYMLRHKMKAGLTGWAQVNGLRGDTDLSERIEYDIYYIKNWSIWLDVKIIILTFIKGFINKNAY